MNRKGHQDLVEDALAKVGKWEEKVYQEETGRSRKWEQLTEVGHKFDGLREIGSSGGGGSFTFGFDESDIE